MYFRVRTEIGSDSAAVFKDRSRISEASSSFNGRGEERICLHKTGDGEAQFLMSIPFGKEKRKGNILSSFLSSLGVSADGRSVWEEVDGKIFSSLAGEARKARFLSDIEEMVPGRHGRRSSAADAALVDSILPPLGRKSSPLSESVTLKEEIGRIKRTKERGFYGHPVHYIFLMDSEDAVNESLLLLLNALNSRGRLVSRRVIRVYRPGERRRFMMDDCDFSSLSLSAYKAAKGGTVVLFPGDLRAEGGEFSPDDIDIEELARDVKTDLHDVLTVVVLPRSCAREAFALIQEVGEADFIVINEKDIPLSDIPRTFLNWAKRDGIGRYYSSGSVTVPDDVKFLSETEAEKMYKDWYRNVLRTEIYPEYSSVGSMKTEEKDDGVSSYDKLHSLIGLGPVKEIMDEIIDFNTYSRMLLSTKSRRITMSRHMVFTGNPGTAKTTVARLFASVMREKGILPKGELIEVGRQDIVARYVGWTAKNVGNIFRRARGSVLFIDEAYSLMDDRSGSFGDEAINAIVQCMENQRDDTIVIFAGYPDRMELFLERNPGLRSRISRIVNFADYSSSELYSILSLMASEDGTILDDSVHDSVIGIFDEARESDDFGNGRFVRNIYEEARMKAVRRALRNGNTDTIVLSGGDFSLSETDAGKKRKGTIGFGF